jgi:hypothetical protein
MFSSFFNKSKPIHIALVCGLITIVFVLVEFSLFRRDIREFNWYFEQLLIFLVLIFTVFVVDFIIGRNKLTSKNSFSLLFFALAVTAIPATVLNLDILMANVFLLFAIRRLISLRSQKENIKKLFDATFWICIASLFYYWALLFLLLIPIALLLFKIGNIKYWLIPITAIITVAILYACYALIYQIDLITFYNEKTLFSFDFSGWANQKTIISLALMLAYFLWASVFYFGKIRAISRNLKPPYYLIFIVAVLSVLLTLIVPGKSGAEWLFFLMPFSIILANYIQDITEVWFKESLIIAFLLLPFLGLVL